MVPKSDHLANPRFDKKPSAQVLGLVGGGLYYKKMQDDKKKAEAEAEGGGGGGGEDSGGGAGMFGMRKMLGF